MPNWCYSSVIVDGPEDDLARLALTIAPDHEDCDLTVLFPTPEETGVDTEEGRLWRLANWGTKWVPEVTEYEADFEHLAFGPRIEMKYTTAYTPATGLLRKISELFPTLEITNEYYGESWAFVGSEIFRGGRVYRKEYDSYKPEEYPPNLLITITQAQMDWESAQFDSPDWADKYDNLMSEYDKLIDHAYKVARAEMEIDGAITS